MKESNVRSYVIDKIEKHGGGFAEAIENSAGVGIADISYCIFGKEGWIECKYTRQWPVRNSTPVLGDCLRPSQKIWFRKRLEARSPRLYIFARVEDSLFLFPGALWEGLPTLTRPDMHTYAWWSCETLHTAQWGKFIDILRLEYEPQG